MFSPIIRLHELSWTISGEICDNPMFNNFATHFLRCYYVEEMYPQRQSSCKVLVNGTSKQTVWVHKAFFLFLTQVLIWWFSPQNSYNVIPNYYFSNRILKPPCFRKRAKTPTKSQLTTTTSNLAQHTLNPLEELEQPLKYPKYNPKMYEKTNSPLNVSLGGGGPTPKLFF